VSDGAAPPTTAVRHAWNVFAGMISECMATDPPDYDKATMVAMRVQKMLATEALHAAGKLPAGK
jgi:hypothetical protein